MKWNIKKLIVLSFIYVFSFNVYAQWNCYATDRKGHFWMSEGLTMERASAIALNFCRAYSPNGGSCHKSKCIEKSV